MKKLAIALSMLILAPAANSQNIEKKVDELLSKMTLKEKIGQLNQYSGDWEQTGPAAASTDKRAAIVAGELGSMLNIHGALTTRQIQEYAMQSRLKIPLIFAQDVIHGYRVTFPIPLAEAASWDLEAIYRAARIAGEESAAAGIHWVFAPMVDISRDPRWGRVMEGAGEDTYLGALIAKARVSGFQGKGIGNLDAVIACAKHFIGYGAAQAGRDYHTTDFSDRTIRRPICPPFKAAVDVGVGSFMTSFNDINGIPATGNKWLFRDVLREEWGYTGIVVSDWGAIGELIPHGFAKDLKEAGKRAMVAGVDMDMESRSYIRHMTQLVEEGTIPISMIDEAVRRVLFKKFELGLFDDPFRFSNPEREKAVLSNPEHRKFAKEIAQKSIVLLKNDNNILPLKAKKIALIGALVKSEVDMKGGWAITRWDDSEYVSLREGFQNTAPGDVTINYAEGCDVNSTDKSGFAEAIKVAQSSDIVVMAVGEDWTMTGEAKSRTDISIPGVQVDLIREIKKTGKPVVVLIMAGRPLTFPWVAENADAILYTWWLGSEAGNAIASVLYGNYNPSGRLPMTFPRSVGQIPIYYNMKNTGRPVSSDGGINYGSAYIDSPNSPQYAFGYGLSYTTFNYTDLKLSSGAIKGNEKLRISCRVTNNGAYHGNEVVQLYIRDLVGSVTRPVKELKGFSKLFIRKGESRTVEFEISAADLAFYNDRMEFAAQEGEFEVMVGGSSDNTPLKAKFELQ